MPPFRILLLKDHRPGHFRKSEGVATAIARRLPVEVAEIGVTAPRGLPSRLVRALPLNPRSAPFLLKTLWNIRPGEIAKPDLILSTGSDTLVPNVLLAGLFGSRNVFVGSVRNLDPRRLSAVLSARPEFSGRRNHFIVLSPSGVDPDALSPPSAIGRMTDLPGRTVSVLVGGPAPDHAFSAADWEALERLLEQGAVAGLRWLVTSSRRTPERVADILATAAAKLGPAMRFIDYRREKAGSIDPLFNADAILVTEDSNTMISEAVAARRPVVALRPSRLKHEMSSLRALCEQRRIAIVAMREASLQRIVDEIAQALPLTTNPLDDLYAVLASAGVVPKAGPAG